MTVRLIIVEDEPPMIELLTRFLNPIASRIDATDDLHEAVRMAELADRNHESYNVCILDLKLKSTGKEEAFDAIHRFKHANCAVVVVSGLTDPHLKEDALAAGADAVVPKDGRFGDRAIMLAAHIATLKLPRESYRSESYLKHVNMLKALVEAA